MPKQNSIRHIDFTINGHRIDGWADDDPPYEFPDIDTVEIKYGKDGSLYASDTGIQGGEVMLKLLPDSRSTKQILRWFAERQRGTALEFTGSFNDTERGYSVQMKGGFLKRCPAGTSINKTFEPVFEFEQILPDYDAADFDPPPPATPGTRTPATPAA